MRIGLKMECAYAFHSDHGKAVRGKARPFETAAGRSIRLVFFSFSTKSVSKLLQNLQNNIKFNFKRRTISSFLKFFIVFEGWGTDFSEVSHLYAITIAYRGSKFSKKHRSYSWPIYIARIFGKNFIWLNGVHFTKKGGFLQIFKAQFLRYLEG